MGYSIYPIDPNIIMAKRKELLAEALRREQRNILRSSYERQIAQALPPSLEVSRVYVAPSHTQENSNCHGQVDIDVETFGDALNIADKLKPCQLSRILSSREGGSPTVSFYPNHLLKDEWVNDRYRRVYKIHPILLQMTPKPGMKIDPMVYLEWFTQMKPGIFANVRVRVKEHGFHYVKPSEGSDDYGILGVPIDGHLRIMKNPHSAPSITAYWDQTHFSDESTLRDLLFAGGDVCLRNK